jgi:hypothetical protein
MLTAILKAVGRYVSPAEKSARSHFRAVDPDSTIAWSSLKEEESRFVVRVFFGSTRPPRYKFYAVSKKELVATPISDDSAYAPKNWR